MSFYRFARAVVRGVLKILFRIHIEGLENIPNGENFIVCANHKSNLDPPLIGVCMPFEIRYMAKEELFRNKFLGALITALGAFPIKRGSSDFGALRTAMKLVEAGEHVAIFPEGGRSHENHLRKGKMGAAMIAVKTGVNILPIGVEGTYKLFSKLTISIGEPIDLSAYWAEKSTSEQLQEITDRQIMPAIATLAKVKTYEDRNS